MEGENEQEESCREWMSQTDSIRGLTADGKSHHRATQVELIELGGDWRYRDGEMKRKIKMAKSWGSSAVINITNILISCDCHVLTMSRAPAAFWRASASVTACADAPVITQADRDRVSERERHETG